MLQVVAPVPPPPVPPGARGVKVVLPVMTVTAAVGVAQALACGATGVMLVMFPATAEFM